MDDEEPVDPLTGIREKCGATKPCAAAMAEYKACVERVTNKGFGTCEPWFFDYISCVDKCAAPKIMKATKTNHLTTPRVVALTKELGARPLRVFRFDANEVCGGTVLFLHNTPGKHHILRLHDSVVGPRSGRDEGRLSGKIFASSEVSTTPSFDCLVQSSASQLPASAGAVSTARGPMESGGGGVPETDTPLERMPSSAESESAFSTTTEAESEMTDAADYEEGQSVTPRQTYFLSYATDCLSAYDLVKKRSLAGIRALDDLCVMIKARVGLEDTYAKGLEKVANQAFRDGLDSGSFREGLEGLRSDLVNKAVQHRALAKNLSSDVLEPLSELRGQLNSKTKALAARAAKLQRDTRLVDERYRRSYARYHRCHREAALSLSAAVEGGAVPPPEPRGRRPSLERSSTNPERNRPTTAATAAGGGRGSPPPPPPAPPLRRRAMSATLDKVREAMPSAASKANKKDLVQWFLPSEKNRKESLIEAAQAAADAAEEARKNCLACWGALRSSIYGAIQEFQRVLTDFQGCEEQLVSEAQDGMRKSVVFESSSLANLQYDLQMLFKGIGGFGGVASAFAAAAAAFTAADSSNPPAVDRVVSRSVSPVPKPAEAEEALSAGEGVEGGATGAGQVGDSEENGGVDVAVAKAVPDSQVTSTGSSSRDRKSGVDAADKSTPAVVTTSNKPPASPCLSLATERPFVFAATLADDVLESLHAEGVGATERRSSDFVVGISAEEEEEEGEEEDAGAAGGGVGGAVGDDREPAAAVARAVEALLRDDGAGSLDEGEVDAAAKACSDSPSSSNRLLLALCQSACVSCGSGSGGGGDHQDPSPQPSAAEVAGAREGSGTGFSPVRVPPASFATLATLLRASLDQATSDREFLQARNCLVTAALYAVDGAEYVSWLREQSGGDGGGGESLSSAVMADSELVSAAGRLDEAAAAAAAAAAGMSSGDGEAAGEQRAGVDYLLLRELRRHSVWATIELWEVSMSDSVVMAMEGGGPRAERWLPGSVVVRLKEARSLLRKCSSLAMEIPPPDLEALMAALNSFVMGPTSRPDRATPPRSRSVSSAGGGQEAAPGGVGGGGAPAAPPVEEGAPRAVGGGGGDGREGGGEGDSGGDSGSSEESESESESYTSESGLSRDEGAP
eukprot:g6724.t1